MEPIGAPTPVNDTEVEVEVITSDGNAAVYEPSIAALAKKAEKDGNMAPMVLNMEAQGASEPEIVNKVLDVTITNELRREMAAPCIIAEASGFTKTNAAAIGQKMVEMALNGNLGAIREILNRTEGKVPNVNKSSSVKMTGSLADLMDKIDANKEKNNG